MAQSVRDLHTIPAQEFCCKSVVEQWQDSFKRGELLSALKSHWKVFVPHVYQIASDSAKEERLSKRCLLQPLEVFLTGSDDPATAFHQLKENDRPTQTCGRVFKMGEPVYSCRDCANDPTCVLCIDCFQKSAHQMHRYRMSTSGGGGYCDCGEEEAWKQDPCCQLHSRRTNEGQEQNPTEMLADDLVDRASAMFLACMQYCVELLCWEHTDNLPNDLQPDTELADTYTTMMFNDEVHTYDQVISTLIRAVSCSQKEATNFATIVDREGRSNVRDGPFAECEKARAIIEQKSTSRHTHNALKVLVMHTHVISHQKFALRLLTWIQTIIAHSVGLRRLFCVLTMQTQDDGTGYSLMEKMLLADTQLWKAARVQSHQLFMAGVLMDPECKQQFAAVFTKWYGDLQRAFSLDDHHQDVSVTSLSVQIFTVPSLHYSRLTKDFIHDDHYRAVSITCISVQIFTVPTLARMLITNHDLLNVILSAFLEHCNSKKNKDGLLHFDRADRNLTFRRAWYMLCDLKYALICKPSAEEWTDGLRESFFRGFNSLLELLLCMQGMDPVTRQTGQHIEFEPEWESAFNVQLKLEDSFAMMIEWCSSDRQMLIEAYRATQNFLFKCQDDSAAETKVEKRNVTVASTTASCIIYSIHSQPVSIHLPLTRLLAGLHLHLQKFDLQFDSMELQQSFLTPVDLIEPPLRAQVLVAQTQAGMWRRNGFSLLNQIFFYHNVKCREHMYNKDILMLQAGASLIPPDLFLIHLLNKYSLIIWSKEKSEPVSSPEELSRHILTLAEEFLHLLIIILAERYVPGLGEVTPEDVVRREIIHQLCITPMAHSELIKALPSDVNHETGIENVVKDVAVFKKPTTGEGKGTYDLKEECYEQYSVYFYHYSRADQSKSEETQLQRRKRSNKDLALPPPIPPLWTSSFKKISDILQCDVLIHLFEVILMRAANTKQRHRFWSEAQLDRVLHLIGLALHEQRLAIQNGDNFAFLEKAMADGRHNILSLLESLMNNANVNSHESQRDLLAWTLKLFTDVRQQKNDPVSMDTLENLATNDSQKELERCIKAKKAAKRRAKIMAQISTMQRNFIKENADLFDEVAQELAHASSDMDISEPIDLMRESVALGPNRSPSQVTALTKFTCILCQEEQDITFSGKAVVLAAFIQRSTVLSQNRSKIPELGETCDPLFMSSDLAIGTHTSTCGHVMHADCWQRYFDAIVSKERRRPHRLRIHLSYDIDKLEFLCPLCESFSNTVIPIIPPLSTLILESERKEVHLTFNDWLDGIKKTVESSIKEAEDEESKDDFLLFQPCPISTITKMMAESVARNFQLLWEYVYDDASGHFSEPMRDMIRKFGRDIYAFGLNVNPDDDNPRVPLMTWNTCAFTLQAIERSLFEEGKPLLGALSSRQADGLNSLVKYAAIISQVMSPDMIKEHCVRLLHAIIPDVLDPLKRKQTQCILDIDMFHFLVVLTMTLPTLHTIAHSSNISTIPTGGLNDQHSLQLSLTAHLIQILLTYEPPSPIDDLDDDHMQTETDGEVFLFWYNNLRQAARAVPHNQPSSVQLLEHVKTAVLPFLRCATLLYHYITNVTPPADLLCSSPNEFSAICQYLSLSPTLSVYLSGQGQVIESLINKWCSNDLVHQRLTKERDRVIGYPLQVARLVPLSHDYSRLIHQVATFTCPNSERDDSRAPTMCLVCGEIVCSQCYSCQTELYGMTVGATVAHAHKCGASTGIFLRVRECQVLLLTGQTKGCFFPPPYLDEYGETDQGLGRGNPLYLSQEGYRRMQRLWLSHGIPQEVAHQLESANHPLQFDWHHL